MDWTSIGDLHQPRARGFGHVTLNGDVASNLPNVAFLGLAIRTVLCVDPVVRQAYREAFGIDPLALGIETHCHRCTCTEGGKEIIIGTWSSVVAAHRNWFIRYQLVTPSPNAL